MIEIQTSEEGRISFLDVSKFILFKWNYKILQNFIDIIDQTQKRLLINPQLGKPFNATIRKFVVHKNASFYYEFDENLRKITILLFIDNRCNPKDYLKLL